MPATTWYSVFTKTGGISKAFTTTSGSQTLFVCGGDYSAFTTTSGSHLYFASAGNPMAFVITTPNNMIFPLIAGLYSAFTTVVQNEPTKLLQIKNGDFDFNTDYTTISLADITGVYDAQTNPGGYQPPLDPPDPLRPYRSDLKLWTIYRIKTSDLPDEINFPTSQANESDVDYTYTLTIPENGVYEIMMIGAPSINNYEDWQQDNLFDYAKSQPEWFATSQWITIDPELDKCLNNGRWAFLESIMNGSCDPTYLEFYADYVALYYANQIQSNTAIDLYNKLINYCRASGSCGCSIPYPC